MDPARPQQIPESPPLVLRAAARVLTLERLQQQPAPTQDPLLPSLKGLPVLTLQSPGHGLGRPRPGVPFCTCTGGFGGFTGTRAAYLRPSATRQPAGTWSQPGRAGEGSRRRCSLSPAVRLGWSSGICSGASAGQPFWDALRVLGAGVGERREAALSRPHWFAAAPGSAPPPPPRLLRRAPSALRAARQLGALPPPAQTRGSRRAAQDWLAARRDCRQDPRLQGCAGGRGGRRAPGSGPPALGALCVPAPSRATSRCRAPRLLEPGPGVRAERAAGRPRGDPLTLAHGPGGAGKKRKARGAPTRSCPVLSAGVRRPAGKAAEH
nr:translation initiation factor IF-2-like [Oryctolagus cuniculus]